MDKRTYKSHLELFYFLSNHKNIFKIGPEIWEIASWID